MFIDLVFFIQEYKSAISQLITTDISTLKSRAWGCPGGGAPDALIIKWLDFGNDIMHKIFLLPLCVCFPPYSLAHVTLLSGTAEPCRKDDILITHNMSIAAAYADRTIIMDGGKILIDGTNRYVFSQTDLLKKASIELPMVTKLSHDLRGNCEDVPVILTISELRNLIEP